MPLGDGREPIGDDEYLYRRIPASQGWYEPGVAFQVSPQAYGAKDYDTTGISLWRSKYKSIEQAAEGREGRQYYVAVLRAGDLREKGIEPEPDVEGHGPGHACIRAIRADIRRSNEARQLGQILAQQLTIRVEGPFPAEP